MNLASNDLCIMRPETCHHHLGTCREPEWGLQNCFKKHTLYLANTSGIKVGITKENPVTKRWVDRDRQESRSPCTTSTKTAAKICWSLSSKAKE